MKILVLGIQDCLINSNNNSVIESESLKDILEAFKKARWMIVLASNPGEDAEQKYAAAVQKSGIHIFIDHYKPFIGNTHYSTVQAKLDFYRNDYDVSKDDIHFFSADPQQIDSACRVSGYKNSHLVTAENNLAAQLRKLPIEQRVTITSEVKKNTVFFDITKTEKEPLVGNTNSESNCCILS